MSEELIKSEPQTLSEKQGNISDNVSILAVIDRAAKDPAVDVDKMERLLALSERIHERQAKALYDQALNVAQGEMRPISKDCHNPQTRSRYASYEAIDGAIRPIYTRHGFAMSFGSKASPHPERVIVTCRTSHQGGHCEMQEVEMPADGKGTKGGDVMTKTHAVGSALSYGKRYLANLIWNLSFGDMDDDGNAASPRQPKGKQNASQVNSGRNSVNPEPVAPKKPTARTREWAYEQLIGAFDTLEVNEFLNITNSVDDWPFDQVPTSLTELKELKARFRKWRDGGEPEMKPTNPDELPANIASFPIHIPPAGVRKADYVKHDTIGELYARRHTDEAACTRLFGFVNSWYPEEYHGMKPTAQDFELRKMLTEFNKWLEAKDANAVKSM